jgi:hypothetical protein
MRMVGTAGVLEVCFLTLVVRCPLSPAAPAATALAPFIIIPYHLPQ